MIRLFIAILLVFSLGANIHSFLQCDLTERNVILYSPIIISITINKGISIRIKERNEEKTKDELSVPSTTVIPSIINKQSILHYPQYIYTDNSTIIHP